MRVYTMFATHFLFLCIVFIISWDRITGEISSGRIKGEDEPRLVSWRVLEGITEPFETHQETTIPVWKQMKSSADQKSANMAIQQALHEYGQILRHPYVFGEMPSQERYDVFLSMSKLLKTMGFHQRAEILLYEAMSHTESPSEAHFQLGLLFLDKEDLDRAKLHFKNCLFFQESDILILIHLSVILLIEGKIYEAKFFLSRIISSLETRVKKLLLTLPEKKIDPKNPNVDYKALSLWLEDIFIKIVYGDYHLTPSQMVEQYGYFTTLYHWIASGEMTGRFIFDLGQYLYEGGRPKIGLMMMKRGVETSNADEEGEVSTNIVQLRLAFEYPMISDSLQEIIESYVNMTTYLSKTSFNYTRMDLENSMDLYWPIPLLHWSGLPIMPVIKELLWRFESGPVRQDNWSNNWLMNIQSYHTMYLEKKYKEYLVYQEEIEYEYTQELLEQQLYSQQKKNSRKKILLSEENIGSYEQLQASKTTNQVIVPPKQTTNSVSTSLTLEIGILGGHMNNHPVGHTVLHRILPLLASFNNKYKETKGSFISSLKPTKKFIITLLGLPLISDNITKKIASKVDKIVNLPLDVTKAMSIIETLRLDIVLFPDWQPFPDQASLLFQSIRIAPIQICFYVRGSSCSTSAVDYYLLPQEVEDYYLQSVLPAASNAKKIQVHPLNTTKVIQRMIRPAWKEMYQEQVVFVDWPIVNARIIKQIIETIPSLDEKYTSASNSASSTSSSTSTSLNLPHKHTTNNNHNNHNNYNNKNDNNSPLSDYFFSPLETEGKIFFEGQPVAIVPCLPMYFHPLMDEILFKIMRSIPTLQVLFTIPETFLIHTQEKNKQKISWGRQLIRRLWSKGGNLFYRIRLLPHVINDQRLLTFIRQSDIVLDTFPYGSSMYLTSLALSVGTPIVTMQSGLLLNTSKEELQGIRSYFTQFASIHHPHYQTYKDHPLRLLISQGDIPWVPTISNLVGFYQRSALHSHLVANSTNDYYELAVKLLTNRELAYDLRVKILEALDIDMNSDLNDPTSSSSSTSSTSMKESEQDLPNFLWKIGESWAYSRLEIYDKDEYYLKKFKSSSSAAASASSSSTKKRMTKEELDKSFADFLKSSSSGGTILK